MARGGLIPPIRLADLTDAEFRYLTERVLVAPALWPFATVAGAIGLDAAVEACRHRSERALPESAAQAVAQALTRGGYSLLSLPPHGDITALLLAVRMAHAVEAHRSEGDPTPPIKKLAERFGGDLAGGLKAFRALRSYIPSRGLIPADPAEVIASVAAKVRPPRLEAVTEEQGLTRSAPESEGGRSGLDPTTVGCPPDQTPEESR